MVARSESVKMAPRKDSEDGEDVDEKKDSCSLKITSQTQNHSLL
jgi:hypothetical protein